MALKQKSFLNKYKSLFLSALLLIILFSGFFSIIKAASYQVDTWVGTAGDNPSAENIFTTTTLKTNLNSPESIVVDSNKNVYISDYNRIIMVNSQGFVSVVAGDTSAGDINGNGISVRFSNPKGLAFDAKEKYLFIADSANKKIKTFNTFTHFVSTFYHFQNDFEPYDLALDNKDNVYVVGNDSKVYKISSLDKSLSVYAGSNVVCNESNPINCDGTLAEAIFTSSIRGIALDQERKRIYLADGNLIRLIDGTNVYSQQGENTDFSSPHGLSVDADGAVYLTDTNNSRLRKILNDAEGTIQNLTGTASGYVDGILKEACFNRPKDIFVAPFGEIFVADSNNHRIRRIYNQEVYNNPTKTRTPYYKTPTKTPSLKTSATPTPYGSTFKAKWISQTTGANGGNSPLLIRRGKTINVKAEFQNKGSAVWFKDTSNPDFVAFYIYKDPKFSTPKEYNDPKNINYGKSYFSNSLWGRSFDNKTEFCRAALLKDDFVLPDDVGVFEFTFTARPDALLGLYREDLSLAHGPHWMSNPYNGDPANIAHVWFPIEIIN